MRIERWSPADTAVARETFEVFRATQVADDPAGPPMTWHRAQMWLENPTQPDEVWVARDAGSGTVTGFFRVEFPQVENRHRAPVLLCVHPAHRRRGVGSALLRCLAERAAANERTLLATWVSQDTPGEFFARHATARPGLIDVRRALRVDAEAHARAAALRATAAGQAAGYSLVGWSGRAPDEFMDGVASLHTAMNDAPRSAGVQERRWDADRVQREFYELLAAVGSRSHEVAAIHDATGEMAALTMVELDPEVPDWGNQQHTAVARPHRGHRLGMLVKTAMLDRLATAEPQLRHILTGNAAVNDHMIAINEALGFEILEPQLRGYDLPVATVLGE
jgi:GNAT superfamily N-acetyltransferase